MEYEKNSTTIFSTQTKFDDENESDYNVDYSKLIPVLINATQELYTTRMMHSKHNINIRKCVIKHT